MLNKNEQKIKINLTFVEPHYLGLHSVKVGIALHYIVMGDILHEIS